VSETTVAEAGEGLSSEVETTEVETPATDFEAQATEFKNRFAGSQRKLTETLSEKAKIEAEVEALRKFKAETEKASMTEIERLQAEVKEAQAAAAAARSEAERERLARKFPLAIEFYGDEPLPSEAKLAALQERLANGDEETEQEPQIDPNKPRKQPLPEAEGDALRGVNDWLVGRFRGE
jgi:hypothetical protein